MRTFYSAESVTEGHPDKLCALIADNVLDACLVGDPASRVACEVMATRGHIIVAGEITTEANPDVFNITRDVLHSVGYDPQGLPDRLLSASPEPGHHGSSGSACGQP